MAHSDETRMRTKSDNIYVMLGRETNEIVEELVKTILESYRKGLEE